MCVMSLLKRFSTATFLNVISIMTHPVYELYVNPLSFDVLFSERRHGNSRTPGTRVDCADRARHGEVFDVGGLVPGQKHSLYNRF